MSESVFSHDVAQMYRVQGPRHEKMSLREYSSVLILNGFNAKNTVSHALVNSSFCFCFCFFFYHF